MKNDTKMLFYNSFYNVEDDIYNIMMYNVETKEYKVHRIKNPKVPVYKLKRDIEVPQFYKETMKLDNLIATDVSYKWRTFNTADLLGRKDAFIRAVKAKAMRPEHIFLDRRTYGSDMFIEDLAIMNYLDSLGYEEKEDGTKEYYDVPPIKNLKRGYYDIETDVLHTDDERHQPITCSTYFDDDTDTCEVFAHIRTDFKGLKEIIEDEESFKNDTRALIRKVIEESTLDNKSKELLIPKFLTKLDNIKFNLNWYNKEKDMIKDSWKVMIQDYKPMFLGIYNAVYDVHHTELRAEELGIKPHTLFCHPEVGNKFKFNYFSTDPKAGKRRHNYDAESYTKITDTQINYFALRPQDQLERESLDAVTKHELGFGKLSYKHITDFIGRLPYLDYRTYLMYNIVDVIIMAFLDMKTDDINSLITRRFIVRTEYARVFSPMNSVTNTFFHLCKRMGYIMSNDVNKLLMTQNLTSQEMIEKLKEVDDVLESTYDALANRIKIAGGLCSDPVKFKKELTPLVEGLVNNKFAKYVMDADAVSMYPKIIEHTNVSKDSLDGRIVAIDKKEDAHKIERATIALIDKSPVRIGKEFFNLPDTEEVIKFHYKDSDEDYIPEIDRGTPSRKLKITPDKFKLAETVRKILSKLDQTKISTSDVKIGIPSTNKYFHLKENESHMKINGSYYYMHFTPSVAFKFRSLGDLFMLKENEEGYINSYKGDYYTEMSKYVRPNIVPRSDKVKYELKLEPTLIHRLQSNKLTYETLEYNGLVLDMTQRTHVFLSDDVKVEILEDNTFVFKYSLDVKNLGRFDFEISTKTLQY